MSLLVKICGLKTPDALDTALAAGADMVGFIFFPASPRHVSDEAAQALGQRVTGLVKKVAVTVDADDATLDRIVASLKPDMLQLHGHETPGRITELEGRYGLPIMKALPIETKDDLRLLRDYESVADALLFDARAPKDATRPGGHGKTFDWTLLRDLDLRIPFVLSGGVGVDNVAEAIAITRPTGVDVSSGVESAPGVKDAEKIRAFVRAARDADARFLRQKSANSR